MAAHWGHTGAPTDKDHLGVRVFSEKLAIRTRDRNLITCLQVKDVTRHNPWRNPWLIRRGRGNPHVEHDDALFVGVVSHRIGPNTGLVVNGVVLPDIKLIPITSIFRGDLKILILNIVGTTFDLNVTTSPKGYIFASRQFHYQFLDKGSHVVVTTNGTFPLFDF